MRAGGRPAGGQELGGQCLASESSRVDARSAVARLKRHKCHIESHHSASISSAIHCSTLTVLYCTLDSRAAEDRTNEEAAAAIED